MVKPSILSMKLSKKSKCEELNIHKGVPESSDDKLNQRKRNDNEGSNGEPRRKIRRTIDERTLPPDEAQRLDDRRRHNRESAARARTRVKETLTNLEARVQSLETEATELRKEKDILLTKYEIVENENVRLRLQIASGRTTSLPFPTASAAGVAKRTTPQELIQHTNPTMFQLAAQIGLGAGNQFYNHDPTYNYLFMSPPALPLRNETLADIATEDLISKQNSGMSFKQF